MDGFDFSNHLRNNALANKNLHLPKATSTGTTIVGCLFDGGIILGADTRATEGPIVADKNCEKVSLPWACAWTVGGREGGCECGGGVGSLALRGRRNSPNLPSAAVWSRLDGQIEASNRVASCQVRHGPRPSGDASPQPRRAAWQLSGEASRESLGGLCPSKAPLHAIASCPTSANDSASSPASTAGRTPADPASLPLLQIHFITENIRCCGAGTAADTEFTTG